MKYLGSPRYLRCVVFVHSKISNVNWQMLYACCLPRNLRENRELAKSTRVSSVVLVEIKTQDDSYIPAETKNYSNCGGPAVVSSFTGRQFLILC